MNRPLGAALAALLVYECSLDPGGGAAAERLGADRATVRVEDVLRTKDKKSYRVDQPLPDGARVDRERLLGEPSAAFDLWNKGGPARTRGWRGGELKTVGARVRAVGWGGVVTFSGRYGARTKVTFSAASRETKGALEFEVDGKACSMTCARVDEDATTP